MPSVLLVDDDPDWRLLVRLTLESDTEVTKSESTSKYAPLTFRLPCEPPRRMNRLTALTSRPTRAPFSCSSALVVTVVP